MLLRHGVTACLAESVCRLDVVMAVRFYVARVISAIDGRAVLSMSRTKSDTTFWPHAGVCSVTLGLSRAGTARVCRFAVFKPGVLLPSCFCQLAMCRLSKSPYAQHIMWQAFSGGCSRCLAGQACASVGDLAQVLSANAAAAFGQ